MADDTRQSPKEDLSKEALTVDPNRKAFAGDQWKDAKNEYQSKPANLLAAGGKQNTAGGKMEEVTISNAFGGEGLKVSDFTELPSKPCVRESLVTGMGSGFALGGGRFIFRGSLFSACNWFVGTTCIVSGVLYQWCLYKRSAERDGMMRAVDIMHQKEDQKKAREVYKESQREKELQREEKRKKKDEELDMQYAKLREAKDAKSDDGGIQKPWWKRW